ncbi:nitroreductase [Pseudonocardia kujensis]|uniref:nitroreductase n=1 Tax=Pseudonocardia kujensis TaxID=1128675 RepID=UPI001E2D82E7|nr:nitroreductase [Pseudonocardia kujensis]MCE0766028.1 nitroreductase [Pseudonocardia kujensis]
MIVEEAIVGRRTVRGFLPDPVPEDLVRRLLEIASRAPSGSNIQPWRVAVVTGEALRALSADLLAEHDREADPRPDYDYYPARWRSPYLDRRRECGWGLYSTVGVARGDRAAAHRQRARNHTFYGAPVAVFVSIDRDMGRGSLLDAGMFVQNLLIAARAHGLESCPQVAVVSYPDVVRRRLAIPETEMLVCGVGLGRIDPDEPANTLRTSRVPVETFATFHR